MKLNIAFSFFLIVIFLISSCDNGAFNEKDTAVNTKNTSKINDYYKKAKQNKRTPLKGIQFIDSALTLSKLSKIDSLEIKCLAYKSNLLFKSKNYNVALAFADSLLQKATYLKDTNFIAKAYFKKAFYNSNLNKKAKAFKYYGLSKKYYQKLNDSNKVAGKLFNMSFIQIEIGDYQAAKELIFDGLGFQNHKSNAEYVSRFYNHLSIIKNEEKQFENALEYNDKAIQLFKNKQKNINKTDSIHLIGLLNSKAVIYTKQGMYNNALNILNTIALFPVLHLKEHIKTKAIVLDNLGVAKGKLNNIDSEKTLFSAFRIRDSIDYKTGLNASFIHLCEFYIDNNKPYKALPWAKRAYKNAKAIESLIAQKEALNYIIELETTPQKKHINAYKKVSDSLTSLSNQVRDIYAEQKYEANEYKMLASKRKEEIAKERSYKILIFSVGFMLILVIIIYYYLSNKVKTEKHKKNQLQTVYDTEIRLSKKVHDELANDVYSLMSKLHLDSFVNDKSEILNNLNHIYNKSRDISRELNDIDTINFKETLQELLSNYSNADTNIISKGLSDDFWLGIPNSKKIVVFRVLQELLINMKKHSQANFVMFNFLKSTTEIQIMYSDDGIGLDNNKKILKNGLKNANNRIESINGVFTFDSELKKGVKVKMTFGI